MKDVESTVKLNCGYLCEIAGNFAGLLEWQAPRTGTTPTIIGRKILGVGVYALSKVQANDDDGTKGCLGDLTWIGFI